MRDRVQVKYELRDDDNPKLDTTVWWGATVIDSHVAVDGRRIFRLLYDAYPAGGFPASEARFVELTGKPDQLVELDDDLVRGDVQTFRIEPPDEPGVVSVIGDEEPAKEEEEEEEGEEGEEVPQAVAAAAGSARVAVAAQRAWGGAGAPTAADSAQSVHLHPAYYTAEAWDAQTQLYHQHRLQQTYVQMYPHLLELFKGAM